MTPPFTLPFKTGRFFFFFRVDFWSTWVLARGVGKEETWRQDMVRSLGGVVGPMVRGHRVEAEQSSGEMRLHGEKGTSVWSSFVAYWVLDPRPGVFPAKEKLLWLHGRQSDCTPWWYSSVRSWARNLTLLCRQFLPLYREATRLRWSAVLRTVLGP